MFFNLLFCLFLIILNDTFALYDDRKSTFLSAKLFVKLKISWFYVKSDRDFNAEDISFGFKNLTFQIPHKPYSVIIFRI